MSSRPVINSLGIEIPGERAYLKWLKSQEPKAFIVNAEMRKKAGWDVIPKTRSKNKRMK